MKLDLIVPKWKNNKDDSWEDKKIHRENVKFPQHGDNKIYPVAITYISQVKTV